MFGVSIICVLCVIAVGSGGGGAPTVSVSGTVTVDGKPLDGATVVFTPVDAAKDGFAPASHGTTDASGKYTLALTMTGKSGAIVGKHRVTIGKFEEPDVDDEESDELGEEPASLVPEHDLTFDVSSSGTDQANFDLSTSR